MFSMINNIIIGALHFIPRSMVKLISNRYIAGINDIEAINTIKKINNMNLSATIDILGEHTTNINEAKSITDNYINLYEEIEKNNLDCNISLKPSHIGSDIDINIYHKNLTNIHNEASKRKNFLRIDMENSDLTDLTIRSFNLRYNSKNNIGIVIQAYLHRSLNDIQNLKQGMNIRLCKGIYNESSNISIKDPDKINVNYLSLLTAAFNKGLYVGIATHDLELINKILDLIKSMNINKDKFEFQVLYGVPMSHMIKKLLNDKYKIRVYVPYGKNWYDYSVRRLRENPNIVKYIIKNLFSKNLYK